MVLDAAPFRKRLLHILLGCLGAAAATGVLTILIPEKSLLWRVTAMGFVAAGAVGLMIPCSMLADRAKSRAAGLFGMTLCVIEFLLGLALIWSGLTPWGAGDELGWTIFVLALCGIPAIGFVRLTTSPAGRIAGPVGLATAAISMIFFLLAIWIMRANDDTSVTGFAVASCGLAATFALVGAGQPGDRSHWRYFGVAAAAVALPIWLYGIWFVPSGEPDVVACVFSVAAFIAFANLLVRIPVVGKQAWIMWGTLAAAAAATVFIDLDIVIQDTNQDTYGFERFAAGAGIITVSGALALLVLGRINRRLVVDPDAPMREISLSCPRCRRKQTLPLGAAPCESCGLIIHTRVEARTCLACGYDISKCRDQTCPECGTKFG